MHPYGPNMPMDIVAQVQRENHDLHVEIDRLTNQKVIDQVTRIVRRKYESAKAEGYLNDNNPQGSTILVHSLRSFTAYLWVRGAREHLKRAIVANAYEEVTQQPLVGLSEETSLYRAMVEQFHKKEEYPSDSRLKFTQEEFADYMTHAEHYRTMYKDAYVAAAQLKAIGVINSPDDPDNEIAEKAVFICYHNYQANAGSFAD
jgi:hypothetical protein